MRSIWTGHISFGLISIPVSLYSAVETSERVGFHLYHRKDMAPIRYKKFCSKEDVEVSNDEIAKGYEVEKKRVAVVEKEELEEVEEEVGGQDRSIDVLQFVDFGSINPLSFEKPYYLAPMKGGEKAYAVLRDALLDARRAGIAKVKLRTKPVLAALIPDKKVLAMEVLRPFDELRDPAELSIPGVLKKSAEVKMARLLIDQMSAEPWDPTAHPNEYKRALKKLLAKKRSVVVAKAPEGEERENVVDLMSALKKSLEAKGAKSGAARSRSHRKAGAA